jgi:hypothetical protein
VPALVVCTLGYLAMFRPVIATADDVRAAQNLSSAFAVLRPSNGNVLVYDADGEFAFPDAAYRYGFRTRWDRGALEEWSAATRSVPTELLHDIENKRFQRIIIRGALWSFPSFTAYAVSYKAMNISIRKAYAPCAGAPVAGWTQYCPI